jgi:hypothetical protein
MAKGKKKKDEGLMDLKKASLDIRRILDDYSKGSDRSEILEADLSKLYGEYKEKVYFESVRGLKPGKEGG